MRRTKIAGLSLLAMLVFSTMAASAAQGAACETKNEKYVFCSGGNEIKKQAVTGSPNNFEITGEIAGKAIRWTCPNNGFLKGDLEGKGVLKVTDFEFGSNIPGSTEACTLTGLEAKCELKGVTKIKIEATSTLVKGATEPELQFSLKGLKIEVAKCMQAGKYAVTGTQICQEQEKEPKVEKAGRNFVCLPAGSTLQLAGKNATWKVGVPVNWFPVNGGMWSIRLN